MSIKYQKIIPRSRTTYIDLLKSFLCYIQYCRYTPVDVKIYTLGIGLGTNHRIKGTLGMSLKRHVILFYLTL